MFIPLVHTLSMTQEFYREAAHDKRVSNYQCLTILLLLLFALRISTFDPPVRFGTVQRI